MKRVIMANLRVGVVLLVLAVSLGIGCAGWWYLNQNPSVWDQVQEEMGQAAEELGLQAQEPPAGLVASGFIEAEEASVTTELGGRIVALHADEGDEVVQGQVLVELDDSLLLAEIEQAEAGLAVAEAALAQVRAGVREETLATARAGLNQALAAQEAAQVAWEDAQAMVENPQDLALSVTRARAEATELAYQVEQAEALANSAQEAHELADNVIEMIRDFEPFNVSVDGYSFRVKLPADTKIKARHEQAMATYQAWEAWTALEQAQAARDGADRYLGELVEQRSHPLVLEAEANSARSQFEVARANVGLARAQVEGLQIGATAEQIAAAEAQVAVARAALETLQVRLEKSILDAPISGLVLERPVHVGELAVPGVPVMTLADLDIVNLTVYVPEDQLGRVRLRQPVSVTVDAYPDRTFPGSLVYIASEAEFTPKNIQTRGERVNMVFAVKVRVPNGDHALKPGMPADAVIATEDTAR
jgi:multidrug efflux pump subunit AcrA (membrane-fusion protein)